MLAGEQVEQASAAKRRRDAVAALGFNAEVRARTRQEPRWWVALRSNDQSASATADTIEPGARRKGTGAEVLPCSSAAIVSEQQRAGADPQPRV